MARHYVEHQSTAARSISARKGCRGTGTTSGASSHQWRCWAFITEQLRSSKAQEGAIPNPRVGASYKLRQRMLKVKKLKPLSIGRIQGFKTRGFGKRQV